MAYWFGTQDVVGTLNKDHRRNERVKATMLLDLLDAHPQSSYIVSLAKYWRGRLGTMIIMMVAHTLDGKTNRMTGEVYHYSDYMRRIMRKAKRMH
jgi:hypothetical protein